MSLAAPSHPPQLDAARRDAVLFTARAPSRCAVTAPRGSPRPGTGRAYCLFSGRGRQNESRRAHDTYLGQNKYGFEKWGVGIERGRQRNQCTAPVPASGRGGTGSGGGGWSGGGGGWFRWFSSGGFWDAAKQTVLTILGIIAAFFLIANFSVLVAAVVNPLLAVLRQIRRALNFAAHCVSQSMSASSSAPKSTPASANGDNLAAVPVKGGVGMTAKERVIRKWGLE